MEIRKQRIGDVLELEIQGRLDGYWAEHLSQSLDDVVREGTRNLRLNLSGIIYLSSAGIRGAYWRANGMGGRQST